MTLYLIAHRVRGEAALDVAEPMDMADGRWWIIPTSGHRAYPYWTLNLEEDIWDAHAFRSIPPMPPDLRDHYPMSTTPAPAQRASVSPAGYSAPKPEDL